MKIICKNPSFEETHELVCTYSTKSAPSRKVLKVCYFYTAPHDHGTEEDKLFISHGLCNTSVIRNVGLSPHST